MIALRARIALDSVREGLYRGARLASRLAQHVVLHARARIGTRQKWSILARHKVRVLVLRLCVDGAAAAHAQLAVGVAVDAKLVGAAVLDAVLVVAVIQSVGDGDVFVGSVSFTMWHAIGVGLRGRQSGVVDADGWQTDSSVDLCCSEVPILQIHLKSSNPLKSAKFRLDTMGPWHWLRASKNLNF